MRKPLATLAEEINIAATPYRMGEFQEIHRQIHGLSRVGTHQIFTPKTIAEAWAFHFGGRNELQFNIGFEGGDSELFRYGVAFSLEPSRSLTDPPRACRHRE